MVEGWFRCLHDRARCGGCAVYVGKVLGEMSFLNHDD